MQYTSYSGFLHHEECEILKDPVVTSLISVSESSLGNGITSQTKMVLLASMCFKSNNQVAQALTITQLAKHHCKQLVPTSELLHISVSIILTNVVVKLCSVQKGGKLSKNVFVLVHMQSSI